MHQLDAARLLIRWRIHLRRFEHARSLWISRAGIPLLEAHLELLALEAARQELGLEPNGVVLEDDLVNQQFAQLDVSSGFGAASADCVQRHALARCQLGGVRDGGRGANELRAAANGVIDLRPILNRFTDLRPNGPNRIGDDDIFDS